MLYYRDVFSGRIFPRISNADLSGKTKMASILFLEKCSKNRNRSALLGIMLFSMFFSVVFSGIVFSNHQNIASSFHPGINGVAVLSAESSENNSSAYRGNQLDLLRNILRTNRISQLFSQLKDAKTAEAFSLPFFVTVFPSGNSRNQTSQNLLCIFLKSISPVRAGPQNR